MPKVMIIMGKDTATIECDSTKRLGELVALVCGESPTKRSCLWGCVVRYDKPSKVKKVKSGTLAQLHTFRIKKGETYLDGKITIIPIGEH